MSLQDNGCPVFEVEEDVKDLRDIERSIIKKYRKPLWSKFIKAIKDYELIEPNDRIAVAISGGKDSLLLAKLLQELNRHGKFEFDLEFIAMDPGYHPQIRSLLEKNCHALGIPVQIYSCEIFEVADRIAKDYPCYICARMRRGSLYAKAQELDCNKLALGHHFNDVIETILLNLLMAGSFQTMMPKLHSDNFENMQIIRPLYRVEEQHIIQWMRYTGLMPLNCACMVASKKIGSTRNQIKDLIEQLKEMNPDVDRSIFKASQNVNLDRLLGHIHGGEAHFFTEDY